MSRHEGVSCDSCLKGNFRGRRYKCLTCFDYDLCAACYEAGATTTRHTIEHPMQCILTRSDFELYYKGEGLTTEQSQSFTCPFCGRMGFTETAIQEHVSADHPDSTAEVVCPICAAQPGGDPNLVTEDFAGHLALEHRPTPTPRDLISFLDEPTGTRHSARRLPHSTRGIGSTRPRRSNMHFSSSGGISSLSPSGRDAVDPIAELLSQLSGVRRNNPTQGSASAQLQQLQIQLQMERQQVRVARQQLERLPRRQVHATSTTAMTSGTTSAAVSSINNHVLTVSNAGGSGTGGTSTPKTSETVSNSNATVHTPSHPQLMLTKCMDANLAETELEALEVERADRSIFLQDLLLNTLMISSNDEDDGKATPTTMASCAAESKPSQFPSSSPHEHAPPPQSLLQQSSNQAAQTQSITTTVAPVAGAGPTSTVALNAAAAVAAAAERPKCETTTTTTTMTTNAPGSCGGSGSGSTTDTPSTLAKRSSSQHLQQRTSPITERTTSSTTTTSTTSSNQRTTVSQNRNNGGGAGANGGSIEYVLATRSPQPPNDSNSISVRGVLMAPNNFGGADTARRKPICAVDTLNQATEPPTSH